VEIEFFFLETQVANRLCGRDFSLDEAFFGRSTLKDVAFTRKKLLQFLLFGCSVDTEGSADIFCNKLSILALT
jgi:hypothetical protein